MMNMENNSVEMCENSCSLMGDVSFVIGTDIIGDPNDSADFSREDLLWVDHGYGQQLPELYCHIDQEYPHEVIEIQETSSFSQNHGLIDNNLDLHGTPEMKSAFRSYKKVSTKEFQFCFTPTMKQKSLKRCFDFLRKIHKNSRERLSCEANRGLVEELYTSTHRVAERNRRIKLNQQFLALRSLLPHNTKKVDKMSTLTNAIKELNRQKLRIEELEQLNQRLTNSVRENSMSEGCSSLSYEGAEDSRRDALMVCICEEVDVLVEKTNVPDELIIQVTLKKIALNCTEIDAIARVDKCLREMNLEVVRIQWRELEPSNQLIEGTIRSKRKGERWGPNKRKKIKGAVKCALNAS